MIHFIFYCSCLDLYWTSKITKVSKSQLTDFYFMKCVCLRGSYLNKQTSLGAHNSQITKSSNRSNFIGFALSVALFFSLSSFNSFSDTRIMILIFVSFENKNVILFWWEFQRLKTANIKIDARTSSKWDFFFFKFPFKSNFTSIFKV